MCMHVFLYMCQCGNGFLGLPSAVRVALAFATKRMMYEKVLVRVMRSCETVANMSVVLCTGKTGILTQNTMAVVAGSVGIHAKFVRQLEGNSLRTNAHDKGYRDTDFSIDQAELNDIIPPALQTLFNEAIAVNSTAFEDVDSETGGKVFVGSKMETALLQFARERGWRQFQEIRDAADIVQTIPFSSERKAMGVVVKRKGEMGYRVYFKGASEILSKLCKRHVVVKPPGGMREGIVEEEIEAGTIDELAHENISRTTMLYASQTLRTIALCYRDLESWPPPGAVYNEDAEACVGYY